MLHPYAHGEGFGFEGNIGRMQRFVDVACRVSRGENHGGRFDPLFRDGSGGGVGAEGSDPGGFPVAQEQARHAGTEEDRAPGRLDRLPHARDDARQAVGADVGMGIVKDFGVGAVEDEEFEGPAVVAPFF